MVQRPPDKMHALKWEFPGGKIERAESAGEALGRELLEELDVKVKSQSVLPFKQLTHEYPTRTVNLQFFHVGDWEGAVRPLEAPEIVWLLPGGELPPWMDVLEADVEVVQQLMDMQSPYD